MSSSNWWKEMNILEYVDAASTKFQTIKITKLKKEYII